MRKLIIIICSVFIISACANSKKSNITKEATSEWRNNNEIDSKPFYSLNESCHQIIGKLKIKSRLHKNLMEKNIFGGGVSSRWLEITKNSITYFTPNGAIADQGICHCENGILTVNWEIRYKRQMEYKIHFNTINAVELRYYDYPYSFDTFSYDMSKEPINPTKIIGSIEYKSDEK